MNWIDVGLRLLNSCLIQRSVGEVGLDHSEGPKRWRHQMETLSKFLTFVDVQKVLILHCWGMPQDNGTEVYMLLHHLVKASVPTQQKIYLHCFTGDGYVLQQWTDTFPNLYLGFTRIVKHFSLEQLKALKKVKNDLLLLETCALLPSWADKIGLPQISFSQ